MAKKEMKSASPVLDSDVDSATGESSGDCPCIGVEVEAYRRNFLLRTQSDMDPKLCKNMHVSKRTHTRLAMLATFGGMGKRPLSLQKVLDNILEEHFLLHGSVLKVIKSETLKRTEDELGL